MKAGATVKAFARTTTMRILDTDHVSDFERVPGLKFENWVD